MTGARSKFLESDRERLARTLRTDKSAASKADSANSGEFPVKQKFGCSPTVGVPSFVDDASSENSSKNVLANCKVSQVLPSQQTATNVTTQTITDTETNVLVELEESLKGVIVLSKCMFKLSI